MLTAVTPKHEQQAQIFTVHATIHKRFAEDMHAKLQNTRSKVGLLNYKREAKNKIRFYLSQ